MAKKRTQRGRGRTLEERRAERAARAKARKAKKKGGPKAAP